MTPDPDRAEGIAEDIRSQSDHEDYISWDPDNSTAEEIEEDEE